MFDMAFARYQGKLTADICRLCLGSSLLSESLITDTDLDWGL